MLDLFELIEKDRITPEERASMKDEYNQQELEKLAGKNIRLAEENGRQAGKMETAQNVKALGILTDEQIAIATGLTLEQIKAL